MSRMAHNEFPIFRDLLEALRMPYPTNDVWSYIWNSTAYSSARFHKHYFVAISPPAPFRWTWKAKCIPRIKFNTWLLFADRLNTRNMLHSRNKHLEEGYNCVMCHEDVKEMAIHYVRIPHHCRFKIPHHCRILNRHNHTGSDEGKLLLSVPTNRKCSSTSLLVLYTTGSVHFH